MILYKGQPVFKRLIVFFISILFGIMGIDRIYLGDYKGGILKFATLGGLGIWYLLDIYRICLGEKIGSSNISYWWSCQLDKKYNCIYETNLILKGLAFFIGIAIVTIYFYGPKTSNKIMVRDNPYESLQKD